MMKMENKQFQIKLEPLRETLLLLKEISNKVNNHNQQESAEYEKLDEMPDYETDNVER